MVAVKMACGAESLSEGNGDMFILFTYLDIL